eukprot:CAMPEP_0184365930 /NCGR_PEP_ID=MMETSP1089-20130417/151208_1 /TAXON_ID=38269 ORGANISM="Gloeochaete wittrockiana, Strain SAG46.84" /NCGR_SAMPLE_ID=MMETSP1089 /ASSEMBLY_ACC=CAM_ASM_000445 /LENGTH=135 /DNA_ID=CAMNT_0026707339 /DNA_START=18 /DNA_END=422 /DNA_ORIENTATION=-
MKQGTLQWRSSSTPAPAAPQKADEHDDDMIDDEKDITPMKGKTTKGRGIDSDEDDSISETPQANKNKRALPSDDTRGAKRSRTSSTPVAPSQAKPPSVTVVLDDDDDDEDIGGGGGKAPASSAASSASATSSKNW